MVDLANILILMLTILLMLGGVLRADRLLAALFLVGFTQIGGIYPVLSRVRIELVVGILVLLVIFLSAGGVSRLKPEGNAVARQFYWFLLVVLLSVPFAVSVPDATYWVEYYFKRCFILFFGVVALLDNELKIRSLVNVYLIAIFWLAFSAVANYLSGVDILMVGGVQRVSGATGLLSNPNGMANTLVAALPLAYYMFLYHWRKSVAAWILLGVSAISLTAIFMSGSRGAFIGLVAALGASVLLARQRSKAFVIVVIVLLLSLAFIGDDLLGRYATILEGTGSGRSANSRILGLQHGITMMIKRPVLGVGIGCYPVARQKWFHFRFWAHNTYGQLIGELGLAGTIAWCFLIYYTVRATRRIRRLLEARDGPGPMHYFYYLSLAIEVSLYTRLVLGMTTHSLHIFFWYLNAGLVVCMERIIIQDNEDAEAA